MGSKKIVQLDLFQKENISEIPEDLTKEELIKLCYGLKKMLNDTRKSLFSRISTLNNELLSIKAKQKQLEEDIGKNKITYGEKWFQES